MDTMTSQLPYDPNGELAWKAYVVAQAAQAMLGLLDVRVSAVACRVSIDQVELLFVASGDVSEDVEDIRGELDVLLDGKVPIETEILQSPDRIDWSDKTLLGIYAAKPSESP